jgi:hypothetical protein
LPHETHPLALANALLAFALAARRAGRPAAETISLHATSPDAIVRTAAAAAVLVSADGEPWLTESARTVAEAAALPLYEPGDLLWASGDPGLLAAEALAFAARRQQPKKTGPAWTTFEKHAIEALKAIITARLPYRDVEAQRVTAAEVMLAQCGDGPVPEEYEPPADDLQKAYSLLALTQHILAIGFGPQGSEPGSPTPVTRSDLRGEQVALLRFLAVEAELAAYYARFGLPASRAEVAAFVGGNGRP